MHANNGGIVRTLASLNGELKKKRRRKEERVMTVYRLSYVIINCHEGHRGSYLKLRSDSVFHGPGNILGILLKNTSYIMGALRNLPAQIPEEIGRNCSNEILPCVYSYIYIHYLCKGT